MFSLWRWTSFSQLFSSVCSLKACEEMQRQRQNKAQKHWWFSNSHWASEEQAQETQSL